jgi:hypothetical protein
MKHTSIEQTIYNSPFATYASPVEPDRKKS